MCYLPHCKPLVPSAITCGHPIGVCNVSPNGYKVHVMFRYLLKHLNKFKRRG